MPHANPFTHSQKCLEHATEIEFYYLVRSSFFSHFFFVAFFGRVPFELRLSIAQSEDLYSSVRTPTIHATNRFSWLNLNIRKVKHGDRNELEA